MNGVEFFRNKNKLTRKALAERSGVTIATLYNYASRGIPEHAYVSALLPLADALGVTLDELVDDYDERNLSTQDRSVHRSCICSPYNAVNNYRLAHNLRFRELADRLGLGDRESARNACKRKTARSTHVMRLSTYEHISVEEFLNCYMLDNKEKED